MSVNSDDQLTALREQRRLDLQKQIEAQAKQQAEAEFASHQKDVETKAVNTAMKQLLTSEARSRIARISLATPERAESIRKTILTMHQNNQFQPPMSDESLKAMLVASQSKSRSNASIRRI